jgi:hypothetical protein
MAPGRRGGGAAAVRSASLSLTCTTAAKALHDRMLAAALGASAARAWRALALPMARCDWRQAKCVCLWP